MAYWELGMTLLHEVLRRWLRGLSVRAIALASHVDRKTVARYVKAASKCGLYVGDAAHCLTDDVVAAVSSHVQVGARVQSGSSRTVCVEYREKLMEWHGAGAGGPKLVRLLQRHTHQSVSLRTLQRFMQTELAKAKGPNSTCYVADCAPGEELQVDYETLGMVLDSATQTRRVLHAFVCTSVYSRHCFVYPCWQETTETTIEALEAAWDFFGGVFAGVIPDNLKAVVIKPDPVNPLYNAVFLEYSQARDFLIGPARVHRPQDKGRVENCVKYTQSDFFAGETWTTIGDWRREAAVWCREQAGGRVHGTTGRSPLQHFEQDEQAALQSKIMSLWDIPRWTTAKVGRDSRFRVAKAWYRVDKGLVGEDVRVRIDRTTIRVQHKHQPLHTFVRVEACQTGGIAASTEEGAQDSLASRSPQLLLAQAAQRGTHVGEVVHRLVGRGLWFSQARKVMHLLRLCELYGHLTVDTACSKLLAVDDDDVTRVERVVKLALEALAQPPMPIAAPKLAPSKYARDNQTWPAMPGITQGHQYVG